MGTHCDNQIIHDHHMY